MALPAFRSVGNLANTTGANLTPPAPAGLAENDVELCLIQTANESAALTTANGFAEAGSLVGTGTAGNAGSAGIQVFWRRWNGSDGDPIFGDPGDHIAGRRYAFSGCILTGNPWNVLGTGNTQAATTSGSATGVTTDVDECLVVILAVGGAPDVFGGGEFSAWANASLANVTERTDNTLAIGVGGAMALATGELASAGASGTTTYTTATEAAKAHVVLALAPVAAVSNIIPAAQRSTPRGALRTGNSGAI